MIYTFVGYVRTKRLFIPSTLKLWNDLNTETRNISILGQYKLSVLHQPLKVGEQLSVGERKYNRILTRLRNRCSSINADLFQVNIIPHSNCSYVVLIDSAEHYFLGCNLYNT